MITRRILKALPLILLAAIVSCNGNDQSAKPDQDTAAAPEIITGSELPRIKTEPVEFEDGSKTFLSVMAYDSSNPGRRPVVLVVPEWWGVTDYIKQRVHQLATLGYLAVAVDMYGNGKVLDNPKDAGAEASKYYQNSRLAQERFANALAIAKSYPQADTTKVAAIGYCFGGSMVLNMARLGEDLKGVVSFHGDLANHGLTARKGSIKPAILVLNGDADNMVPVSMVNDFKKEMEAANANMQFIGYPNAKHAFTNPDATATGEKFKLDIKYDEAADKASWEEMKNFLARIFS